MSTEPGPCQQKQLTRLDCATMARDVADIKKAILGDKEFGHMGLVEKLENQHQRIKALERWRWYLAGAIAAGVFLLQFIHR